MPQSAPTPMTRNYKYSADVHVPPYEMPFRSIPVYAELEDKSTVIACYNWFTGIWIMDHDNSKIEQRVICWYGPVQ